MGLLQYVSSNLSLSQSPRYGLSVGLGASHFPATSVPRAATWFIRLYIVYICLYMFHEVQETYGRVLGISMLGGYILC